MRTPHVAIDGTTAYDRETVRPPLLKSLFVCGDVPDDFEFRDAARIVLLQVAVVERLQR